MGNHASAERLIKGFALAWFPKEKQSCAMCMHAALFKSSVPLPIPYTYFKPFASLPMPNKNKLFFVRTMDKEQGKREVNISMHTYPKGM